MTVPPDELARVVVIGTSCCGKTTFARRLSDALGHRHVELDALHWGSNWVARALPDFRADVAGAVASDRWVVDGSYGVVRDLVWPRATAIVWLNYSMGLVFGRALRRTVGRAVRREVLFSGNRETFRRSFLSRESILWWVISTYRRRRQQYRVLLRPDRQPHLVVHEFRRPRDAEAWLSSRRPADLEVHATARAQGAHAT